MKVLNENTSKDIITDIKNMSDEDFIKDLENQGCIYLGEIPNKRKKVVKMPVMREAAVIAFKTLGLFDDQHCNKTHKYSSNKKHIFITDLGT